MVYVEIKRKLLYSFLLGLRVSSSKKSILFTFWTSNCINTRAKIWNLSEELLKGVYLYGFSQPSNIQIKGIQSIGTGKDCILQSQSGTGKTATYLLGILNRLDILGKKSNNISIIITPTRELANQVYNVAVNLNKYTNYKIGRCIGGIDLHTTKLEIKKSITSWSVLFLDSFFCIIIKKYIIRSLIKLILTS